MPYLIQYVAHISDKVAEIDARTAPKKEAELQNDAAAAAANMMYGDQTMMITNGPAGYGMDPSYGMNGQAPPQVPAQNGMGMGVGMPQQGMSQGVMGMQGGGDGGWDDA